MQPDGWEEHKLGDIAKVEWGNTSITKKSYIETGYPAFSAAGQDGFLQDFEHHEDGIVLSAIGARCGRCFKASGKWTSIKNTITVLSSDNELAELEYLYYFLNRDHVWPISGGAQPFIGLGNARKLLVPIPPINEQRKIADVLQSVDEAITATQDVIDQTRKVKQGVLHRLLTRGIGHTTFKQTDIGEIPESWEVKTLEEIADVSRGKFSARPRNDPQFYGGDIPFIQTGDITASEYYVETHTQTLNEKGLTVSKIFDVGTIFITIAANIGDTAMSRIPMACPDSVVGIKAHKHINSHWLMSFLRTRKADLDSQATVNAQKNINLTHLKPMKVPVPPKDEQDKIAELLYTVTDAVMSEVEKLEQLQTLKSGMMSDLLSGRVRVPLDNTVKEKAA